MGEAMNPVAELLGKAREAVVGRAGALGLELVDKGADPRHAMDLVTEADLEVDRLVTEGLQRLYPGVPVVSEEHEAPAAAREGDCFLLDPIDGTHNYASGLPFWAISLARMQGSEIREGWLLDGPSGRLYHAKKGGPATLDGRVLTVSARPPELSLLSLGLSPAIVPLLLRAELFSGMRILGSHSLGLAHAASGEVGLHAGIGHPWDVAAGYLLIEAAGGLIVDFEGRSRDPWDRRQALAGAPHIVDLALEILQQVEAGLP
ncbi:MAG: inositol monophosphatase [Myxococcota bacterium]|nr:inositol monophosphatase [Myxococcota bacterium]